MPALATPREVAAVASPPTLRVASPAVDGVRLRSRHSATALLGAFVGCAVLVALLWRLDVVAAFASAARVSWLPLAAAVLLNVPCTMLRAVRSQALLRALGATLPLSRMTSTQLGGQVLSWLTPGASGDLVRPYMWRRSDGIPIRDGVSVVFYERVVSFLLLCSTGAGLSAFLVSVGGWLTALVVSAIVSALGVAAVLVLARRSSRAHRRLSRRVREGLARLGVLVASPAVAARFTALTLAVFVLSGLQIVLLTAGLGAAVALWVGIAAYCLSQAAGSLSTLPLGLGVTDVVVVALLVAAGLDASAAAATMLLTRLAVTLPLGLAGASAYALFGRTARARSAPA